MKNSKEPYIILLDNEDSIIESNLDICIAKAQARTAKPVVAGWLCTYGCGTVHSLTDEEKAKVIEAFPYLHRSTQDD